MSCLKWRKNNKDDLIKEIQDVDSDGLAKVAQFARGEFTESGDEDDLRVHEIIMDLINILDKNSK